MQVVSRETYESLVEDVDAQLGGGVDIRDDYSGRGMFGATCLAMAGDHYALDVFVEAARCYGIEASLRTMQVDSLGMGHVFYWPSVEVEQTF